MRSPTLSLRTLLIPLLLVATVPLDAQTEKPLRASRIGNSADSAATPRPGFALMGGGTDLNAAFRFLCQRANGGDFVILRASGDDAYNPYVQKLCPLNSVTTLIMPSRAAANDPAAASAIRHAEALFIAGGDQANYINFWTGTPVQSALNQAIRKGVPLGGTSAGLAVLGEWTYSAQGDKPDDPDLSGAQATADPFGPRLTLVHGFLDIPQLKGIITDTHFAKRDRMGRLLTFLARLNGSVGPPSNSPVRGIGVDEGAALLVEPDGSAKVVGRGAAWFISLAHHPPALENGPLTAGPFSVQKVVPGHRFAINSWQGDAQRYSLTVDNGHLRSSRADGSVY